MWNCKANKLPHPQLASYSQCSTAAVDTLRQYLYREKAGQVQSVFILKKPTKTGRHMTRKNALDPFLSMRPGRLLSSLKKREGGGGRLYLQINMLPRCFYAFCNYKYPCSVDMAGRLSPCQAGDNVMIVLLTSVLGDHPHLSDCITVSAEPVAYSPEAKLRHSLLPAQG